MLDSAVRRNLRLPKGWPGRVRSSTIQAISLAHFSLTFARGVAVNSINERMRLQAEVDRFRQEVALLGEELRIKDARMLRIPAQRRPHYPPTERLAILELRAARAWSTAENLDTAVVVFRKVCVTLDDPGALLRQLWRRRVFRSRPARRTVGSRLMPTYDNVSISLQQKWRFRGDGSNHP